MKTGIIIQARVGSSRLPYKVVLPFDHTNSIIEIILRELKSKGGGVPLVLATTVSSDDVVLGKIAKNEGVDCFMGPEQDVLDRFIQAAEMYDIDRIVRICADNPFLDVPGTMELLEDDADYDYVAFRLSGNIPSIKSHLGLWGEVVSLKALKKVKQETDNKIYFEHVTNYIYGHPDKFNIKWIDAPAIVYDRDDIRLTIDDIEDFNLGKELLYEMKQKGLDITTENIVEFIDRDGQYVEVMKEQIKKYTK